MKPFESKTTSLKRETYQLPEFPLLSIHDEVVPIPVGMFIAWEHSQVEGSMRRKDSISVKAVRASMP